MINAFHKLPGYVKTVPGLERVVLRRLPATCVLGTLLLCVPSLLARLVPWDGNEAEIAIRITTIDIYAISVVVLHWTVVLTAAIAAFIVMVMKGPAYVADAYPLVDSDEPQESASQ